MEEEALLARKHDLVCYRFPYHDQLTDADYKGKLRPVRTHMMQIRLWMKQKTCREIYYI